MRISVVIPTFNHRELVRKSLAYVAAQCLSGRVTVEVIVVDDGSNDGTDTMIQDVRLKCPHDLNYVFRPRDAQSCRGRARNLGIAAAEGDYVLFMDSGVVIPPNFIAQLGRVLTTETLRPVLLHRVVGLDVDAADFDVALLDGLTPESLQERIDALVATEGWADRREGLFWSVGNRLAELPAPWALAWSCLMTVPKDLVDAVGAFDETFMEWGAEDIDLAYRLYLAGATFLAPSPLCGLHIPHAVSADAEAKFVSNQRNEQRMHAKHYHLATEVYVTYAGLYFNQILGRFHRLVLSDILPFYPYAFADWMSERYLASSSRALLIGDDHLARLSHWNVTHHFLVNPQLQAIIAMRFKPRRVELQLGTHTSYGDHWFETAVVTDAIRLFGEEFVTAQMQELLRIAKQCVIVYTENSQSPAKRRDGAGQWWSRNELEQFAASVDAEITEDASWGRHHVLRLQRKDSR